jgi:hypothetical protein
MSEEGALLVANGIVLPTVEGDLCPDHEDEKSVCPDLGADQV